MSHPSLLIEFLTEELPPINLEGAVGNNFSQALQQELKGFVTSNSQITTLISPRRFGCLITHVMPTEASRENLRKGPAITNGLKDEQPTPALIGFACSCKLDWQDLIRGEDGYFYAKENLEGRSLNTVLYSAITNALKKLAVGKYMRWGSHEYSFIRPVHNLMLMHGAEIIHLAEPILGLIPNKQTRGHRIMSDGVLTLNNADDYLAIIQDQGKVIAEFKTRRNLIEHDLQKVAVASNLRIHQMPGLLDEVTALVEYPVVLQGEFAHEFLEVPQECLILSMAKNQKYFALVDANGKLSNKFLFVANIDSPKPMVIVKGNEKVLSARLADAKFFFDVDKKTPLNIQVAKLTNVLYHNKLGSQAKRNERLAYIAKEIAPMLDVNPDLAVHTAHLLKADLVTEMVGEFPELQGTMGKYYALNDDEPLEVANAIEQHYYPRFSGDALPAGNLATLMSLSDKLETLVGIWGIGLIPTGDKDPYALRRAALGIVRILLDNNLDIYKLLTIACKSFSSFDKYKAETGYTHQFLPAKIIEQIHQFILDRLANYLKDTYKTTCIQSIIATKPTNFHRIISLLDRLQNFADDPKNKPILEANKRIDNILKKNPPDKAAMDENLFENEVEKTLLDLRKQIPLESNMDDWDNYFAALARFNSPITDFFDKVMVISDDKHIRNNRLNLLDLLHHFFNQHAILSELN